MKFSLVNSFIEKYSQPNFDNFYEENESKLEFLDKEISKLQSLVEILKFSNIPIRKEEKISKDSDQPLIDNINNIPINIQNLDSASLNYFKQYQLTPNELLSNLSASFMKNIPIWLSNINTLKNSYLNILDWKVFQIMSTYLILYLSPELQEQLFSIILLSKENPELSIASSNAISILNSIGFSFRDKNLENVNIPNADLSGALLINTNFQNSNLSGVDFSHSNLFSVSFDDCRMEDVTLDKASLFKNLEKNVRAMGISPCGKFIAINFWLENEIKIFSFETREMIKVIQVDYEVNSIVFSQCGTYLAYGLINPKVILLDAKSIFCPGEKILVLQTINTSDNYVIKLVFSKSSTFLAIFTNKAIRIWNIEENSMHTSINDINNPVWIGFSPSKNDLAMANWDGSLSIWRIITPRNSDKNKKLKTKFKRTLVQQASIGDSIKTLEFTPCSNFLIFETSKSISMWSLEHQDVKVLVSFEMNTLCSWVLTPDGNFIIYFLLNRIYAYNIEKQSISFQYNANYMRKAPILRYLNKLLLIIDDSQSMFLINVKDLENHKDYAGHTSGVQNVSFSPCGKYMLSVSNWGVGKKWNIKSKKVEVDQKINYWSFDLLKYSPCDNYLIANRLSKVAIFSENIQLDYFINTNTDYGVTALSNDGLLAIGGRNNKLDIFDIKAKNLYLSHCKDEKDLISALCFSPSNELIGIGTTSGNIKIWYIASRLEFVYGNQINTYKIISVHFSPCGRYFAWTVETFNKIYVLDLRIRNIRSFEGTKNSDYSLIKFSLCGEFVASINKKGNLHIWDVNKGNLVVELKGSLAGILDFEFSRCGKWIVTGSLDKTVKLYNFEEIKNMVGSQNNPEIYHKRSFIEWSSMNGDLIGSNISIRRASISKENKEILNKFR
ncbi:unnamed protein product [Blepharisma stoltei]|uniref:Uncharacterized protein n=1 Tax=Blepharisma stoltei TaxID=1481888 RepID=A0AAU9JS95_9CILI|nr:unnamed protein product [Blepharisma stoltei]